MLIPSKLRRTHAPPNTAPHPHITHSGAEANRIRRPCRDPSASAQHTKPTRQPGGRSFPKPDSHSAQSPRQGLYPPSASLPGLPSTFTRPQSPWLPAKVTA
ncbi:hypothetical protein BD414DRAFT_498784 [Trametes punicea]|nr:hypothetical protein BD414DRAFT_498784 [Trametes punicea]